ncbi:hypothetical protein [Pseudoalteromonas luteoviolacea]|uniref:Uncharacterized protein n=1 Tax=Pseudoalteromonas luteoviolacea NCIMB 1942 TaxID=1365253 RepID=A0A161XX04_9GAMM|nr:hypothetical protein [Pseudoalteromonas luteoviolacea]KZN47799.1 hypothetical protein N482_09235 [Pseudoalteromonas luteoviolacea NCIMB 1942]KZW99707.1 hypothetical protein JL49_15170 [Pseudoalteromonas luteoviolacea]
MKHFITFFSLLMPLNVLAVPTIDSKEYKVMLSTTHFSKSNEHLAVNQVFEEVAGLTLSATSKPLIGTSYLSKIRQVRFYDVAQVCTLKELGYVFRERIENGRSEVTLKYRHVDSYLSDFEDVSSQHSEAKTKLEADFSIANSGVWKIVYGHSTKVPNSRYINEVKDINKHFTGFDNVYRLPDSTPLSPVSGLAVYERVYEGYTVDLGRQDAEFSLTLWYQSEHTETPLVAELSFKYADQQGDFSKTVTQRAARLFENFRNNLNYIDSTSMTKTQFVYHHQPSFCAE